ncbi:hypothetical protein [Halomarina pelagica]|uniref:hypothetical protein n=1 Tax=Halomarina pelagica TaxID=2961599 RepID=UPI0020C2BF98|nr:hypothetical protein [Halomarina sp. BND7]
MASHVEHRRRDRREDEHEASKRERTARAKGDDRIAVTPAPKIARVLFSKLTGRSKRDDE